MKNIVVCGGGVMGSSTAFFLKLMDPSVNVTVVERDFSYSTGATTRSVGGLRQHFNIRENIDMGLFACEFFSNIGQYLSVEGEPIPDVQFRRQGYSFVGTTEEHLAALKMNEEAQHKAGVFSIGVHEAGEALSLMPYLNPDGVTAFSYQTGEKTEGWFDPALLLAAFRQKAQSMGVSYVNDVVTEIKTDKQTVSTVELKQRGSLPADIVVNALGSCASQFMDVPIKPKKRSVFQFECKHATDALKLAPLVFLMEDGVYFRPEGNSFLAGSSPLSGEEDPDADLDDFEPDYDLFDSRIWPALASRVPQFEGIRLQSAYAGHYEVNTVNDALGILGESPEVANLYCIAGFSGHGLQQGPAAGRGLAELIVSGEFQTLDLSRMSVENLEENAVNEKGIV